MSGFAVPLSGAINKHKRRLPTAFYVSHFVAQKPHCDLDRLVLEIFGSHSLKTHHTR